LIEWGGRHLAALDDRERAARQGNDNIISVDAVHAIETTGNHNRVTWNRAAEGEAPGTSDLGNGNAIRRATAPLP
jgi:hypothetical protein